MNGKRSTFNWFEYELIITKVELILILPLFPQSKIIEVQLLLHSQLRRSIVLALVLLMKRGAGSLLEWTSRSTNIASLALANNLALSVLRLMGLPCLLQTALFFVATAIDTLQYLERLPDDPTNEFLLIQFGFSAPSRLPQECALRHIKQLLVASQLLKTTILSLTQILQWPRQRLQILNVYGDFVAFQQILIHIRQLLQISDLLRQMTQS
jgi:hypothetical protein